MVFCGEIRYKEIEVVLIFVVTAISDLLDMTSLFN